MKFQWILILFLCLASFAVKAQQDLIQEQDTVVKIGFATYYAKKFEGRKTTSGERYKGVKLTAAHLKLPFGTKVTVTNPKNGKSVVVKVNDRGPFSKKYIIDLSEGAAKKIGIYKKGHAEVELSYTLE